MLMKVVSEFTLFLMKVVLREFQWNFSRRHACSQKLLTICTKFSLERDELVKFSTESNGRQPRGREEKEKLKYPNMV